jgi:hypothetical protein
MRINGYHYHLFDLFSRSFERSTRRRKQRFRPTRLALLTAGLLGGVPVNREKSDPSSLQTRYSWQHMSEFYPTARIERSGKVGELPREIDRQIEEIAFVHDGKKETDRPTKSRWRGPSSNLTIPGGPRLRPPGNRRP